MKNINLLIPLAGVSKYFDENGSVFPKPLVEINGKPMIQHTIESFESFQGTKRFIFVIRSEHSQKFHLENSLKLLTNNTCEVFIQRGDAKGAVCSCLLAVHEIETDDELIISNGDQRIDANFDEIIAEFRSKEADAGVLYFQSVHPQWSFVRFHEDRWISEASEKNPISRNAIAGFYYFRRGRDFVKAAKQMIKKDVMVNDLFFIAPTLNELVLSGMRIWGVPIDNQRYHSFYSREKIEQYQI